MRWVGFILAVLASTCFEPENGQRTTRGSGKKNEAQLDAQSPSPDRARAFPLIPRPSASKVVSHIQLQSKSRSHGYRTTGAAIST